MASDFGGTRNGVAIQWPQGIKEKGGVGTTGLARHRRRADDPRGRWLPEPKSVNGTVQTPIKVTTGLRLQRRQRAGAAQDAVLRDVRQSCDYNDAWFARTLHRAPWQTSGLQPLTSDVWELSDVKNDFSLTKNLAAEQGEKSRK